MTITLDSIITLIGIGISLVFSIIAVCQSHKAGKDSREANKLAMEANNISYVANKMAEEALEETRKDHFRNMTASFYLWSLRSYRQPSLCMSKNA